MVAERARRKCKATPAVTHVSAAHARLGIQMLLLAAVRGLLGAGAADGRYQHNKLPGTGCARISDTMCGSNAGGADRLLDVTAEIILQMLYLLPIDKCNPEF